MKIVIIGYSGSGKSTLAKTLGAHYNIAVLHLDTVNFLSGWKVRDEKESNEIVKKFMEENDSWIIDGNYYKIARERFELADKIIFLLENTDVAKSMGEDGFKLVSSEYNWNREKRKMEKLYASFSV